MAKTIEKVVSYPFKYSAMPHNKRKEALPERNVCSLYPAELPTHAYFTGNGRQSMYIMGDPYNETISCRQEALYEPMWKTAPEPPDLTGIMPEVRRLMLDGQFTEASNLVEKTQLEAGFGPFMTTTNLGAVIPMSSLQLHNAFQLKISQPEKGKTENYLRWLDMMTGCVTVQWENDMGTFRREAIVSYKGDVTAVRFIPPKGGTIDAGINIIPPKGRGAPSGRRVGLRYPGKCTQEFSLTESQAVIELAYYPDYGNKGYCTVIRFMRTGGKAEVSGNILKIAGADSLVIVSKTVKYESGFTFGCSKALVNELQIVPGFDEMVAHNRERLGGRMALSRILLGDRDDYLLSSEELLKRNHTDAQLDPMLLSKLYDMGRFYQIADTGDIPPMWGQHNINTNLQVCAGNNTGLFDEMDTYFRYYESKFDDFRTNARKLFGARGLLASVHCDYDSGLYYHFSKTYPHYCWTGCLGWIYNEFWGYYLVSGDKEFLKNRVIPALKEIALFFEDYACDRGPDGHVLFYPSFSPENPTPFSYTMPEGAYAASINSVMDVMICHEVLDNLISGCNELGIEQENIARWEAQRASLPRWLADEEGGLKEWAWYGVVENYNHRHVSHHYGVWPGRLVTWEEQPELAQAIQISNRKRGHQDDSAHGIIHRLFSAIRLKDLDETVANLSYMLNHGFVTRALNTSHFPYTSIFPDLQGAMPAVLLEMCVFSRPGTVELLPAMPGELHSGSIEGVWLYTWAKLERMDWDGDGISAVIVSNRKQTITIRCRKSISSIRINGKDLTVEGNSIQYDFDGGEKIELELKF
ncbi:MAG: glycoside hydrolase family 95 protein [Treponema sp.]|nr:glycoside hydrolase family 95 protein [Treponema sp.]